MAKDPIQELKEEYSKISPLFEQLRIEINASKQGAAADKIKEIERSLDELKRKIVNDFRWLLPQEPVQQQKKSLFGFKK
ncbi:MAG: hypothetical protein J4472_02395 [DPANN group archaeon]|nr:hypothetical protein [DPANN group archaeon]